MLLHMFVFFVFSFSSAHRRRLCTQLWSQALQHHQHHPLGKGLPVRRRSLVVAPSWRRCLAQQRLTSWINVRQSHHGLMIQLFDFVDHSLIFFL
jgi:hypothetical protein